MFDTEIIVIYQAVYDTIPGRQLIENAEIASLYNLPKYSDVSSSCVVDPRYFHGLDNYSYVSPFTLAPLYSFFSSSLFSYDIDLKLFLFSDILLLSH